ncbi:SH3 domain containing protein [Pyrenophora tritici-repentis]|uniref:SH3 domain containing protein n=1 Tax=Pyrenophora tritici-repentis TaxID=45151 RepID=A0A2W1DHS6_9PLEO|nr:SH3 domain-containing protein [Pyrenophora tritici-repentis]KAF7574262.1 SH3 domain containing protein [Pyrenophora tritici-repentis]KAG9386936.1 SH3 domain containing protein [Pyrenophora tritici-repentis]KAI0574647.1 SH3 domain-containing protein [Pyrenophora tritici-repentis]KAI0586871.1 SH3 domain-containing protein [Pyrenophora tritici-repentis]
MTDSFKNAMINRALGDIKNNLQFLVESNVLSSAQHDAISSQLPVSAENSARALPVVPTQQLAQMSDAGDLALMPNDKVVVTEYMNNEWWKGRNERTGMEGIFPASYVRKEEKAVMPAYTPSATPAPSNYGNMPLDVASGAQAQQQPAGEPSKMEANGKKFGKKLGNAAIFGAGATIGGKIVNGIF